MAELGRSMNVETILIVLAPAFVGLAALVVGILLLRRPPGESQNSVARTIGGILCILFMIGCSFVTFALGMCAGIDFLAH